MGGIILDGHVKKIEKELVATKKNVAELLKLIRKPGFTTPVEFELIHGATRAIALQSQVLVKASGRIISSKTRNRGK